MARSHPTNRSQASSGGSAEPGRPADSDPARLHDIDEYAAELDKSIGMRGEVDLKAREIGPPTAELYFATVRAIGTPLRSSVIDPLGRALASVGYSLEEIQVSEVLKAGLTPRELQEVQTSRLQRYKILTRQGEIYCERVKRRDAIILEAVRQLHDTLRGQARERARNPATQVRGVAYLFRNLMHPEEVTRLRKLYGSQLFVIAAFSPEAERTKHLSLHLANDDPMKANDYTSEALDLMLSESGRTGRQGATAGNVSSNYKMNIPDVWQHADLFLDVSDETRLEGQIERLIQLIFSHPFRTPRPVEVGMSEAFNAALESGNLARPVGAAIVTPTEDVVAIGTNNVPRPGGGIYRGGMTPDHRDHTPRWRYDPSDRLRKSILRDLVERMLQDASWLAPIQAALNADEHVMPRDLGTQLSAAVARNSLDIDAVVLALIRSSVFGKSQFFDVVEYGRTLHAEMDAITSAARRSVSTQGGTLYCTTLPCHECARLIIGAGIKRVIFVEPYEKSRAMALFSTEVVSRTMSESRLHSQDDRVHFIPYVGVSPARFHDLFSWVPRKADDMRTRDERLLQGEIVEWDPKSALIRGSIISDTALESANRFVDVLLHERETLEDLKRDVERLAK